MRGDEGNALDGEVQDADPWKVQEVRQEVLPLQVEEVRPLRVPRSEVAQIQVDEEPEGEDVRG
jgi:hypothetical protein